MNNVYLGCKELIKDLTEEQEDIFIRNFGTVLLAYDTIIGQRARFIEDGEYIVIYQDKVELYSIPPYGGEETLVGTYKTIKELMDNFDEANFC